MTHQPGDDGTLNDALTWDRGTDVPLAELALSEVDVDEFVATGRAVHARTESR